MHTIANFVVIVDTWSAKLAILCNFLRSIEYWKTIDYRMFEIFTKTFFRRNTLHIIILLDSTSHLKQTSLEFRFPKVYRLRVIDSLKIDIFSFLNYFREKTNRNTEKRFSLYYLNFPISIQWCTWQNYIGWYKILNFWAPCILLLNISRDRA